VPALESLRDGECGYPDDGMNDTRLPRRPASHQLEELSRPFFDRCLPKNWVATDAGRAGTDYGADLHVDLFDDDKATGLELLIQLKASEQSGGADTESLQLKTTTFNYLRGKLQVVMLVKFVESENEAYWLLLSKVSEPADAEQKEMTVRIPKENRLSAIDWNQIAAYVRGVTNTKLSAARASRLQQQR
jgi:hypothetical protein